MDSILELKDLSLEKEDFPILSEISLSLEKGNVYALMGPNGAGKSTLFKVVMGLRQFFEVDGEILYKEKKINNLDLSERSTRGITMAWQEPVRFEGISVEQYLESSYNTKSSYITGKDYVDEALKLVGLTPEIYKYRMVDTSLSGGERKRVELASVLLTGADLILLDEPDSGIDVESFDRIVKIINLLKEKGATLFLISHNNTLMSKCDKAFLLCKGKIIKEGKPEPVADYYCSKCGTCEYSKLYNKGGKDG